MKKKRTAGLANAGFTVKGIYLNLRGSLYFKFFKTCQPPIILAMAASKPIALRHDASCPRCNASWEHTNITRSECLPSRWPSFHWHGLLSSSSEAVRIALSSCVC